MKVVIEAVAKQQSNIQEIMQSLKAACQEKQYELQLQAYQALGETYLSEKADPINAIALYNFALAICQDEQKHVAFIQSADTYQVQLIQKIKEAEASFLFAITDKSMPASDYKLDQAHKAYLKAIRDEVRAKLSQHDALVKMAEWHWINKLGRLESIKHPKQILEKHPLSIQQIYREVSEQLRQFVRLLIEEYKQVLGEPSCDYAIICFGSLARDEATPYSDLEFGILLAEGHGTEENKNYFRALTKLLNIKIINLGETTQRMQDIQELREAGLAGRYSESPTKPGFSFDGNNKDGRKTPLGNRYFNDVPENMKYELILTPKQMAQLHNVEWYRKDKHLSTVLLTTKVLDGNEKLCERYEQEVEAILSAVDDIKNDGFVKSLQSSEIASKTVIQTRSLGLLQESIESYQFRGGMFDKEGHFFDAKYHLYRQPNMYIDHLATYFGVREKNLWDRIESLFNPTGEIPNRSGEFHLRQVVTTIMKLRLSVYLRSDYRDNHIIPFDWKHPEKNQTLLAKYLGVDQEQLFQIFFVLIPFKQAIDEFIKQGGVKQVLLKSSYYYDGISLRGWIYNLLLDYGNAAQHYISATTFVGIYDTEPIPMAAIWMNLGNIYFRQERHDQALQFYKNAQQLVKLARKGEHDLMANIWLHLGNVYYQLGHYNEALKAYYQAKSIQGANHITLIGVLTNLGNVYRMLGRYMEALEACKEAIRFVELIYGTEHILITDSCANLGNVYEAQGRYKEALFLYEKVQRIVKNTYGIGHILMSNTWTNLGNVYDKQGRYEEALQAHEEAKRVVIAIHGPEHVSLADSWTNLGIIYDKQGHYEKALQEYEKAKKIVRTIYGDRHAKMAAIWISIAQAYKSQGRYEETLQAYKEAQRVVKVVYGIEHPLMGMIWMGLGNVYEAQARYEEALLILEKAQRIIRTAHGVEHPLMADCCTILGNIYHAQGRYEDALKVNAEAKRIYIEIYSYYHISVARALNNLGNTYTEQKRFEDARNLYKNAVEIYDQFKHLDKELAVNNLKLSYICEGNTFMLKDVPDIEAARKCYKMSGLISGDPAQPEIHHRLAREFYQLNLPRVACEHYRIIIKLDPNNTYAYHNVACLLHAHAQIRKDYDEETVYYRSLKESEKYFRQAIELNFKMKEEDAACYTEFAQFMLKNCLHYSISEFIEILNKTIQLKQYDRHLAYNAMERSTLDSSLQQLLDQYREISFRAHHLAHYLLIQAYLLDHRLLEAGETFRTFKAEVAKFKPIYEKEQMELSTQAGILAKAQPEQAEAIQQAVLQQQQASKKEQQLVAKLLEIAQQSIISCSMRIPNQLDNQQADTNFMFKSSQKLLLVESPEEKLEQRTDQYKDLSSQKKTTKTFSYLKNSPVTAVGAAHDELLNQLKAIIGNSSKEFQAFFSAIEERAYAKALRRACTGSGEKILKLVSVILEYKKILSININEQAGDKRFEAIHYAALKGNQALYDLLIEHGADVNLIYEKDITVSEYMQMQQQRNQNNFN